MHELVQNQWSYFQMKNWYFLVGKHQNFLFVKNYLFGKYFRNPNPVLFSTNLCKKFRKITKASVRRCLQTARIIPTKHINPATGQAYVSCTPHKALARAGAGGRRSDDVLPCPTWLSRPPARTGRTRAGRKPSRRSSRYTAPAAPAGWSGKLSAQMLCHRLELMDILLQRRDVITVNCGNSNDHDKKEDTDVSQATKQT